MLTLHAHKKTAILGLLAIATILPITTFIASSTIIHNASAITNEIPEGYTTITDPVFYDCIVKAFKNEFPNESIATTGLTDQQLAKIKSLNCSGLNKTEKITDTTGLEKMTNLTDLSLDNNNLSEIDVTKNTALTNLRLYANNLSEINVTKNTTLTFLDLYDNNLSEIDVTKNTALANSDLSYNNLSEIDVTKNTALAKLDLNDNNLSEIDVTKNTALTFLDLDNNNLSEIDITKNTALIYLYLNDNNLSEIDVTKNTALTSLSLGNNSIFDFSSAKNLNLDNYSSFTTQKKTVETDSITYVLPPLFTQVKTEGWGMYTDKPFILTNAILSPDGKSITIINPNEPATIQVNGGLATQSILTVIYNENSTYTYALSFNANGGSNAPETISYGPTTDTSHTFTIPTTEPIRSGYTFLGWADTADATTANQDYTQGSTITINSNKTLYAVWQVEEPGPTIQVPETGLTTNEETNGTRGYDAAIVFSSLVFIESIFVYIVLKIRTKRISKTHQP